MSFTSCRCSERLTSVYSDKCDACIDIEDDVEWKWDETAPCPGITLSNSGKNVTFYSRYSSGTAAARGDMAMTHNHHYFWEIRLYTRVYGTDVMIGVATPNFALDQSSTKFISLLGSDAESWGFSYSGKVQHGGESWQYSNGFVLGDVVGAHLDTWNGTLSFYKNGNPLGTAFRGLRNYPVLYPVASSTASQVSMSITSAISIPASLFTLCCRTMARYPHLIGWAMNVPGLKKFYRYKWLFLHTDKNSNFEDDDESMMYVYKGPGLFRTVPGLSSNLVPKKNTLTPQEEGSMFDYLLDRSITRSGVWREFSADDETTAIPHTSLTENNDIYSDLITSDDEEMNEEANQDIFEHREEKLKFSNSFKSPTCEICRVKPAVSIRSCLKKCVQCFFMASK